MSHHRQTVVRLRAEVGLEASQKVLGTQGPSFLSSPTSLSSSLCLPCLVLRIDSFLWFVLTLGTH